MPIRPTASFSPTYYLAVVSSRSTLRSIRLVRLYCRDIARWSGGPTRVRLGLPVSCLASQTLPVHSRSRTSSSRYQTMTTTKHQPGRGHISPSHAGRSHPFGTEGYSVSRLWLRQRTDWLLVRSAVRPVTRTPSISSEIEIQYFRHSAESCCVLFTLILHRVIWILRFIR